MEGRESFKLKVHRDTNMPEEAIPTQFQLLFHLLLKILAIAVHFKYKEKNEISLRTFIYDI
jgi:hypothetical protein